MAVNGPTGGDAEEGEGAGGIFADINITPLTDIFLVLLIIFMVTTTAIAEAGGQNGGLRVNLPHGGKSEALAGILDRAQGQNAETLVLVQADRGVAHGRVVSVMELARKHGLGRLAIATREDGP